MILFLSNIGQVRVNSISPGWIDTDFIEYTREEFNIQCEGFDGATGEKEYPMLWQQK